MSATIEAYKTSHKVRFVTATSLFDGHDATINASAAFCSLPAPR